MDSVSQGLALRRGGINPENGPVDPLITMDLKSRGSSGSGGGGGGRATDSSGNLIGGGMYGMDPIRSGGGGGGDPTRDQYRNPTPTVASTPVNPMELNAYNRANDYESNVAKGTNEETVREIGRARDEISVGMQKEGEAAMGRGADAGLFRSRALESGKRNISNLQGRLADAALGRRNEAIQTLTGAAGQAASGQRTLHLGTIAASQADQRIAMEGADQAQRFRQAPYNNMLSMMGAVGQYGSMLAPAVGGGGFGSGGFFGSAPSPTRSLGAAQLPPNQYR